MAIHIKNPAVTRLAAELASLTGESRTEAIRKALEEKMARLLCRAARQARRAEMAQILGCEARGMLRAGKRKAVLKAEEVQELLAYGP